MDRGTRTRRMRRSVVGGLALAAGLGLAACGGATGTDPGDSVLVDGTTRAALSVTPGGPLLIPTGASCHYEASYELDMTVGTLSWSACRLHGPATDPASYAVDTGTRTLTSIERAQVSARIQAVHVTDSKMCGADKDSLQLTIDSRSGHRVYGDDFYGCLKAFDLYADSQALGNLRTSMDDLSRQ